MGKSPPLDPKNLDFKLGFHPVKFIVIFNSQKPVDKGQMRCGCADSLRRPEFFACILRGYN
jgi:hypothetical protein